MQRRDFLKATLATATLTAAPSAVLAAVHAFPANDQPIPEFPFVDSHLHYLDFLQTTDGLEALVAAMDQARVRQAVLFGMPMIKQWDASAPKKPSYYLSDDARCYHYSGTDYLLLKHLGEAPENIRRRFLPFICGVKADDMNAADLLRRLEGEFPGQIAGIGEIMCRHDDLTALTYGEPPRADHPAMLRVYDLAAEMNMPVLIHQNMAAASMNDPIYLPEMENALRHNRKTKIIWAHVGISRRVDLSNLPEIAADVLKRHANLYFDLSWLVFENYVARDDASLDTWAALLTRHPDRFLIGTDVVGHWKSYVQNITKYQRLLDRLSPEVARKTASGNILSLVRSHDQARSAPGRAAAVSRLRAM